MINSVQSTDVNFGSRYCYIPKCKARCCSSAPLPTSLVTFSKLREKQIRRVFFTIPAPNNNPYCRHSVIPVTKPLDNYIFKIGKTKDGKKIFELDKNKILSEEDNYCPFLTEIGRCNIYKQRPKVCRDFGKKGWFDCEQKISLKELISYKVKEFIDALKYTFKSNK